MMDKKSYILSDIKAGQVCVLENFMNSSSAITLRLSSMGFIKGAILKVKSSAPLGCPMQVECSGSSYSIRKNDASHIMVSLDS